MVNLVGTDPAVRPAATVILLRDSPAGPEVFMVRRHHGSAFMANAHVFPGGRVEPADFCATPEWCDGVDAAAVQLEGLAPADSLAHAVAAARELFEEAGVLLTRDSHAGSHLPPVWRDTLDHLRRSVHDGRQTFRDVVESEGLRLAIDLLVPFAHWVTPPGDTRCFDTRFFAARLPTGQLPAHDGTEAIDSTWITPAQAIAAAVAGTIVLPIPTWVTLRELQPFSLVDDALRWSRTRTIDRRQPRAVEENGRRMMVLEGGRHDLRDSRPGSQSFEIRFVWTDDGWRPEGQA
jgi:8-oxo-dGTP pyrophosphatase MutT (NUDIX family)